MAAPVPTPTPTATPEPTATPVPTPTPVPAKLEATALDNSGLVALEPDPVPAGAMLAATVDGVIRAVGADLEVWVPSGSHEVCVVGLPAPVEPVPWIVASPDLVAIGADAPCATLEGRVNAAPRLFPEHRIVAHYGTAITPNLGILGEGTVDEAIARVVAATQTYAGFDDRQLLPAFEFIATVAQGNATPNGTYSWGRPVEEAWPYLEAIRAVGGVMMLDFQPGRAPFIDQVREYEELIREPDVHVALDPEWSMGPGQVPGRVIGHTDPEAVGAVMEWLDGVVQAHGLPQKLLIVHQFKESMIERRDEILPTSNIAIMFHVDGQGPVPTKYATWDALRTGEPYVMGFKLFFDEDSRLMTPEEVMALEPRPSYVSYQ